MTAAYADAYAFDALEDTLEAACGRVPPLWPLRHFVAANPYLGFTSLPFDQAMDRVEACLDAPGHRPLAAYQEDLASGRIGRADLDAARKAAGHAARRVPKGDLGAAAAARCPLVSERVDAALGLRTSERIVDHLSRFCAARFDLGQASWTPPGRQASTWAAWRTEARLDPSLELEGLHGFRAYVDALPDDPRATIEQVLAALGTPPAQQVDYLTRLLGSILGWAGHARYRQWDARLRGDDDDTIVHLLAARLAYEGALFARHAERLGDGAAPVGPEAASVSTHTGPEPIDATSEAAAPPSLDEWQRATEIAHQRRLFERLRQPPAARSAARPMLEAIFCIDVRSETLRRCLEQQSDGIVTRGFAGFFGVAFESATAGGGTARGPALLAPPHRVEMSLEPEVEGARASASGWRRRLERYRKLAVGAFPFVESLGLGYGVRLLSDGLGWSRTAERGGLLPQGDEPTPALRLVLADGDGVEARVDAAEAILRTMGLTQDFAEVVLLCGHGSRSANNPFASSLDCGACGGHAGDQNARVVAALLNDAAVRDGLAERGLRIPSDTLFVPALHETTEEVVELLPGHEGLAAPLRGRIEAWLRAATDASRAERAARLAAGDDAQVALTDEPRRLRREARRRSRDWSETRPEWGLAGNAAFIAAPRTRTRGLDLEGRCFLHDYDARRDPDGRVLETVLTAPLVVASWINLQYYGAAVAPERFGSGDKTLHNVVGRLGVLSGGGGDLRSGLPWQSLHDGERWIHEPLRLTAIIEASTGAIDAVLARHEGLRELVDHEWLHLFSWSPSRGRLLHRSPGEGRWVEESWTASKGATK